MDDPNLEYEETINKLSEQITELFTKLHYYQAVVAEKDAQINQLTNEISQLKTQIQNISPSLTPPPYPSQQSYTPPSIPKLESYTSNEDARINKRVCPNCGAMGFAIREVDDKSRIISYIPRRIYAKKKACTKCRYE
ncbi:MAG: hypothetical protein ACFE75_10785, partial [Candidatus Hodarchaeota archaeon]